MKAQLNVRLDQALVQQAQKAAKKEGRTLAACVAMALERWLAAPSSAPSEPLPTSRLDDLEKRLERLEQQKEKASAPRKPSAPAPPIQAVTIPQVGEAITTKALADLLQMRRGTLNARIARAGGALPGLVIEGWCCLGTQVPKRGGPAQALWQQS
jgi:antitoxin component of RelBE/YafQ-DinJ toxin-antitoxin module